MAVRSVLAVLVRVAVFQQFHQLAAELLVSVGRLVVLEVLVVAVLVLEQQIKDMREGLVLAATMPLVAVVLVLSEGILRADRNTQETAALV